VDSDLLSDTDETTATLTANADHCDDKVEAELLTVTRSVVLI